MPSAGRRSTINRYAAPTNGSSHRAAAIAFANQVVHAAEIAASIQYDFAQPPAGLSADFDTRAGISLRFLAIKAIDAFQVDAALWQPDRKSPADTTLIVMVHGSGSSYQRPPQSALGPRLAAQGYAALAISRANITPP